MTPDPQTLIAIYQAAYLEILQRIATKEQRGSSTVWEQAIIADVMRQLQLLDAQTRQWIEEQFPAVYLNGMTETIRELADQGVQAGVFRAELTGVHKSAVEVLAQQLTDDLGMARNIVGRRIKDLFRDAGIQAVTRKVSTGQTREQAQRALRTTLADQGVPAFVDSRGREWRLDSYSEMVIRSTTKEATNLGRITTGTQLGYDLVQMSVHFPTCAICAQLQGRIYSVSGNDKRYPALYETALRHGFHIVHPHCGHTFAVYVEALADDPESDREHSNRPFDIDPRTAKQREAYAAGQQLKRSMTTDRRQWERYQTVLPNDTPSFSGFRRMKAAQSDTWAELQVLYRDARAQIGNS